MKSEYELKIEQRLKNYIEYYKKIEPIKRYSLTELMDKSEMELLALMPNNQSVDEHSDSFGYHITKYITNFEMHKVIDGSWNIGFYEGHRDKAQKDLFTLFEITYVKNLKIGLIDLFLMVQNRSLEYWSGIESGKIKIMLSDSWDDRKRLKLDEKNMTTEEQYKEADKDFHNWLEQFIKESGHSFGMGFYFELKTGEVFYNGTDEYKQWYDGKLEEYKTKN